VNGVPEAVGRGVGDLVDLHPAIGVLVGILLIALVWVVREWRASEKARIADKEAQLKEAREDRKMFERLIDRLEERAGK
jgi:hypothetical protein